MQIQIKENIKKKNKTKLSLHKGKQSVDNCLLLQNIARAVSAEEAEEDAVKVEPDATQAAMDGAEDEVGVEPIENGIMDDAVSAESEQNATEKTEAIENEHEAEMEIETEAEAEIEQEPVETATATATETETETAEEAHEEKNDEEQTIPAAAPAEEEEVEEDDDEVQIGLL